MKKNIGNFVVIGFFCIALVLFFLTGVKGSWLNTLGGKETEDAEKTERRRDDSENPGIVRLEDGSILYPDGRLRDPDGTIRRTDGYVRTDDNQIVNLESGAVHNILAEMEWRGMREYIGNGIRIFFDDLDHTHIESYTEPPHEIPKEYEYTDEELLADRVEFAAMMRRLVLDGCHFESRDCRVSFWGMLFRKVGEEETLALEFGLRRCGVCGRLLAFPLRKAYTETGVDPADPNALRETGIYMSDTHVHSYAGPLEKDWISVPCGTGTLWEGKAVYDPGNPPGTEPVEGFSCYMTGFCGPEKEEEEYWIALLNDPENIAGTDPDWDAILRYIRLWLAAVDPAEIFGVPAGETP